MEDAKVFDLEDVQPVLREIAAANREKYTERFSAMEGPGCRYVHPQTGECSCIIGVLLDRLGFPRDVIAGLDSSDDGQSGTNVGAVGSGRLVWDRFTERALTYMGRAQLYQDATDPWGHAVDRADRDMVEQ